MVFVPPKLVYGYKMISLPKLKAIYVPNMKNSRYMIIKFKFYY